MRLNHIGKAFAVAASLTFASTAVADGACCNPSNKVCVIRTASNCATPSVNFLGEGTVCADCFSGPSGACCIIPDGPCAHTTPSHCNFSLVEYKGDGTTCIPEPKGEVGICRDDASVPAVSEWGIATLALLLLVGAKVYFSRRRTMQA